MKLNYPWQLYHWHLELSAKCTLKCPRCPRNEQSPVSWTNEDISLNDFKNSFTPEFIQLHVDRFTLCGDIGDPIYAADFLPIIRYIKEIKPTCHIFIITNGSYKKIEWWEEVATILNEYASVNFSVDGFDQESNNLYRIGSDFDSIMDGMYTLGTQSNCFVNWAAIYFSFNQDNQNKIRNLAILNNCDQIQWTRSTKFRSKYGDTYGINDTLEPRPEFISSTHRYERVVEKLSNRTIDNVIYMNKNIKLYNDIKTHKFGNIIPLCLVGNRGMYVSADGTVHPCSWTSYPFIELSDGNKNIKYEDSFFYSDRKELSIKYHDLIDVLNNPRWKSLFAAWNDPNKTWVECNTKCNCKYVDFEYAVGYETN